MLDNKKGLTLIELLGVIVIIGIIATIAFFSITRIIEGTQKDAFIANVNNFIEAAKLDAETRWLQDPSLTTFTYEITTKDENDGKEGNDKKDEKVVIILKLGGKKEEEEVNLGFDRLGFDRDLGFEEGAITIEYTEDGIKVKIIKAFANGRFSTIEGDINLPLNRGHLKDAE